MLPKSFQKQNIEKKNDLISQIKLYTFIYDYELSYYYGKYVKESYDKWGNIVDSLGVMKLTGYNIKEVEFNFNQLMGMYYIDTHKITTYEIININKESIIGESIL